MDFAVPTDTLTGTDLSGRYRLLERIGEGGMSIVYRARNIQLESTVCVKVLRPDLFGDSTNARRLQSEAKALAALSHPNILSVIAFDRDEDGRMYLVTEYIDGINLSDLIKSGSLTTGRIKQLFKKLAEALQSAHDSGVIHRDLKPSNVMVTTRGDVETPIILDFGIAKMLDGDSFQRLTRSGMLMGTPQYMAPEQCTGAAVDARTDVYSLGCLLYECLKSRPPFAADSAIETMMQHVNDDVPVAPGPLGSVAFRAMAKDPADRFQSAREFGEALSTGTTSTKLVTVKRAKRSSTTALRNLVLVVFIIGIAAAAWQESHNIHAARSEFDVDAITAKRMSGMTSPELLQILTKGHDSNAPVSSQYFRAAVNELRNRNDVDESAKSEISLEAGRIADEFENDPVKAAAFLDKSLEHAQASGSTNAYAVSERSYLYGVSGDARRGADLLEAAFANRLSGPERIMLVRAAALSQIFLHRPFDEQAQSFKSAKENCLPGSLDQAINLHDELRCRSLAGKVPQAKAALADWKKKYFASASRLTQDEIDLTEADLKFRETGDGSEFLKLAARLQDSLDGSGKRAGHLFSEDHRRQCARSELTLGEIHLHNHQTNDANVVLQSAFDHAVKINDKLNATRAKLLQETAFTRSSVSD